MSPPFDQPEYERWIAVARQTLSEAQGFCAQGVHPWAAFAAQQAGEAALKALLRGLGKAVVGHAAKQLFDHLAELGIDPPEDVRHAGRVLDHHSKGTRYPDEYPAGVPKDYYDERIAGQAIDCARVILEFVDSERAAL